ncbi:MAG: hypothetical protein M1836_004764 [Candelina mexicana]|nr:MAG: hypothetical protein M1836_004764 [Candelina mexicana]
MVLRELAASAAIDTPGALIQYYSEASSSYTNISRRVGCYAFATLQPQLGTESHQYMTTIDEKCHIYHIEDVESFDDYQHISVTQKHLDSRKIRPSMFEWTLSSLGQDGTQHPADSAVTFELLYGAPLIAAVYVPTSISPKVETELSLEYITTILKQGKLDTSDSEMRQQLSEMHEQLSFNEF